MAQQPYDLEDARMRAMNISQFGENYYASERPQQQSTPQQPPRSPRPPRPMPSFEVYQAQFEAYRRFMEENPRTTIKFSEFQEMYTPTFTPLATPSFEEFQAQFKAYRRFIEANPGTTIKFSQFQKNYTPKVVNQQAGSYKQKYLKYKQKYLMLKNN